MRIFRYPEHRDDLISNMSESKNWKLNCNPHVYIPSSFIMGIFEGRLGIGFFTFINIYIVPNFRQEYKVLNKTNFLF